MLVPRMTAKEVERYSACLADADSILEFGCGGSTALAVSLGVRHIWSVESDGAWIDKLRAEPDLSSAEQNGRLVFHQPKIGSTGAWGKPTDVAQKYTWYAYHSDVWKLLDSKALDVVFVDGRFRMACALQAAARVRDNCLVVVHDFWRRERYSRILEHFDTVDRVDQLAVLRVKKPRDQNAILNSLFDVLLRAT